MHIIKECWDEELCLVDSLEFLRERALSHASKGGQVGDLIARLIHNGDYRSLVTFELNLERCDWDVYQLIQCRQALAFFTKLEPLDAGFDKEQVAWDKFCDAERKCSEINEVLRRGRHGEFNLLPCVVRLLAKARRKVLRVMGPCPDLSRLSLQFGPGATTVIKRKDSCPQNKFAAGFQCSTGLLASGMLPSLLREFPHWTDAARSDDWEPPFTDLSEVDVTGYALETHPIPVDVVPGRLEFVPKNAKTHRSILVEPVLNGLLQGGIGRHLEKRLRIHGLDIRDQSRNAAMARRGSITGELATLDLSSASDLISYELVRELVSDEWFDLLKAARTGSAVYRGAEIRLQKFSSMGNGFTFPLETLIFWAIATSASEREFSVEDVGVYGDDIVVPAAIAQEVIGALELVGFSVNTEKSYCSGPFRESCGKDYYKGINTRPFYQKHLVSGATLFNLHNFYYRQGQLDDAEAVKALIPPALRLYGPDGYGDGHLLSEEWPTIRKDSWIKRGYSGTAFETFSLKGLRTISRYPGDYVSPLYSVYVKDRAPVHELFPCVKTSTPIEFGRDGRPSWTTPGSKGYKRVLIYTLA